MEVLTWWGVSWAKRNVVGSASKTERFKHVERREWKEYAMKRSDGRQEGTDSAQVEVLT